MVNRMFLSTLLASATLTVCVSPVRADYWTQYQSRPDAPYPEDQGWQRYTEYGGAQRSIDASGALVLDSLGSPGIVDYYEMLRPGLVHAAPGHPFALEWRGCVDESTAAEVAIAAYSDDQWGVSFHIVSDWIYSAYESPLGAPLAPGTHTFRMTTPDMRQYDLTVDGVDALQGAFIHTGWSSRLAWGDGGQGGVNLGRWSYVGFGIVPETGSAVEIGLCFILVLRGARRG